MLSTHQAHTGLFTSSMGTNSPNNPTRWRSPTSIFLMRKQRHRGGGRSQGLNQVARPQSLCFELAHPALVSVALAQPLGLGVWQPRSDAHPTRVTLAARALGLYSVLAALVMVHPLLCLSSKPGLLRSRDQIVHVQCSAQGWHRGACKHLLDGWMDGQMDG